MVELDDKAALTAVRICLDSPMDCQKCPLLHQMYCRHVLRQWLDEYIQKKEREEDDLK